MAMMLLNAHATVTVCHSRTRDLPDVIRRADIVVGAVGKPEFIKGDWIQDGAVVIDAGYHPGSVGDIELKAVMDRCAAYTPVPGGVGPMTIATPHGTNGGSRGKRGNATAAYPRFRIVWPLPLNPNAMDVRNSSYILRWRRCHSGLNQWHWRSFDCLISMPHLGINFFRNEYF